jgi:hypothetical protein
VVTPTKMAERTVDVDRRTVGSQVQSLVSDGAQLGLAAASTAADVARTAAEISNLTRR